MPVLWSWDRFSGFVCLEELRGADGGSCCCSIRGSLIDRQALTPCMESMPLPGKLGTAVACCFLCAPQLSKLQSVHFCKFRANALKVLPFRLEGRKLFRTTELEHPRPEEYGFDDLAKAAFPISSFPCGLCASFALLCDAPRTSEAAHV